VDSPLYRHDDHVTSQARDFLLEYRESGDERPFCLTVWYQAAHPSGSPKPALKPLYDMYRGMDLPLPSFTREDYERLPEHAKRLIQFRGHDESILDPEYHRNQMAIYFAGISHLDHQVGAVLEALERAGLGEETVVIFTSDHGDNMGRHGMWGKMNFYDGPQRVPFYVRCPGCESPRAVEERVSLIDVLPTLAELAGCEASFPVDGASLVPLLSGSRPERPDRVIFSEYHGYLSASDMYMAVRGDFKYCHYLLEPGELYNLSEDPGETDNLIGDPLYEPVRAELEAEIRARVDIEAFAARILEYNRQRQAVAEGIAASPVVRADSRRRIDEFRERWDEPWWDGGEFMAQFEKHLADDPAHASRRDS
jgi:choline-sulfatase